MALLLFAATLFFFFQIVALNGVMDDRATTALVLFLLAILVILVLGGIFAGWACKLLILRFRWHSALASLVSVVSTVILGSGLMFLSIIVSILAAGIR